jgi:mRNA-degrading endonuclease RelE of RelBE toxin-antitoxin system
MRYDIILAPEAIVDFNNFKATVRSEIRDAFGRYLRNEPKKVSKTRIKRLRGFSRPQYRLRVGDDVRAFYDVSETQVEVLAIVSKADAEEWLKKYGELDEKSGSD